MCWCLSIFCFVDIQQFIQMLSENWISSKRLISINETFKAFAQGHMNVRSKRFIRPLEMKDTHLTGGKIHSHTHTTDGDDREDAIYISKSGSQTIWYSIECCADFDCVCLEPSRVYVLSAEMIAWPTMYEIRFQTNEDNIFYVCLAFASLLMSLDYYMKMFQKITSQQVFLLLLGCSIDAHCRYVLLTLCKHTFFSFVVRRNILIARHGSVIKCTGKWIRIPSNMF